MTDIVAALSYGSIILAEGGVDVTEENLTKLLEHVGVTCDPWTLTAFVKSCTGLPIQKMVNSFGDAPAGGAAPAAQGGNADAPVEEAKEPTPEPESSAANNMFG